MSRRQRGEEDLEARVLAHVQAHPHRSFKVKELQRALRVPQSRYRDLRRIVFDLSRAGRLVALPRRRFGAPGQERFPEAVVEGVGQRATHVRLDDGRRFGLLTSAQERVVPGDRVRVRTVREGREILAQIERLVHAARRHVFGTLQAVGDAWVLVPESRIPGWQGGPFVDEDLTFDRSADGQLAQGWLPAFDPTTERPRVTDVEVLGADDHPQAAMSLRIARSGWPRQFGEEAEQEATHGADPHEARSDRTAEFVVTIDPIDAKDHDDAISIEPLDDGGFVLGVYIADVAAYVREDGALDREARERCTSVYPPGRVLPMLPHALSSGACSLHHAVERDVVGVKLHYDAEGTRRGVELGLARIRSRASLAYEHAEALLGDDAFEVPEDRVENGIDRERLRRTVRDSLRLASRLRERRRALGSLFVQRPEREFRFDDHGHVAEVHLRPLLRSHWIIEEFMLEANRAVAQVLHGANLPLLWRIHEAPDETKVDDLVELLQQFGVRWTPGSPVSGSDYGELFASIEGKDEAPLIHLLALRSLMKARYRAGWDRHFGLAFDHYTHFTSPIRRYPDLHNQRWLHRLIGAGHDGDGWIGDALARAQRLAGARLGRPADRAEAEHLADLCSELEREATQLERDCADICAADALKPREGEEMEGRIVSVLGSGVFVELEDTGLDGFVGVERLGRDWYHLDTVRHTLVGERTGRRFRLGQRVRVLLEYVDVANGRTWLGGLTPVKELPAAPEGQRRPVAPGPPRRSMPSSKDRSKGRSDRRSSRGSKGRSKGRSRRGKGRS